MDAFPGDMKTDVLVRMSTKVLYNMRDGIPEWRRVIDRVITVRKPIDCVLGLLGHVSENILSPNTTISVAIERIRSTRPNLAVAFVDTIAKVRHALVVTNRVPPDVDLLLWTGSIVQNMIDTIEAELDPYHLIELIESELGVEDYILNFLTV